VDCVHSEDQPSGGSQMADSHRSSQQGSLGKAARLFLEWTPFRLMVRSQKVYRADLQGRGKKSGGGKVAKNGLKIRPLSGHRV
jgi:hypothetical protein